MGQLVHVLRPPSWYAEPLWSQNARDLTNFVESGVFDLSQAMFELHLDPGLASPAIMWTEKMPDKHFLTWTTN